MPVMPPTPQYCWPLLCARASAPRSGSSTRTTRRSAPSRCAAASSTCDELKRPQPGVAGVIAATRGNHGQSVAFAARRAGLRRVDRRAARQQRREERGDARARRRADRARPRLPGGLRARQRGWRPSAGCIRCRSFHPWLVRGVASYALELFRAVPDLDTVYVPIGLGSGICGMIAARDALGLQDRGRRRRRRERAAYALSVRKARAGLRPTPPTRSPTAWPAACRTRRRSPIILRGRRAHRHGLRSRDQGGDAPLLHRHAQRRRRRRRRRRSPPR